MFFNTALIIMGNVMNVFYMCMKFGRFVFCRVCVCLWGLKMRLVSFFIRKVIVIDD